MEQETERDTDTAARYRVKKICIRRGWAIDQIKFEYDDEKTWSVGVDGGRKDNREFIMTPGEYITRVTHETLNQRWYAGAAVEFETNKGRVMSFHPHLRTGLKDQVVSFKAAAGKEIIMLKIKHGKLLSVVEQVVPTMEVIPVPSSWFVHVDKMGKVSECKDKKEALKTSQKSGGISIDVKSNKIIHKTGNQTLDQECQKFATEKGYFISSKQDAGTLKDIFNLIHQHFDRENDTLLFLTTVMLLITSHYIGSYSQILSGYTLTSFVTENQDDARNLTLPNFICDHACDCDEDKGFRNVLIMSLLGTQIIAFFLNTANIYTHSILKEALRLPKMKKDLFNHTLRQEMDFFDQKTEGDIRSAMNPLVIVDIIAWRFPYFISNVFKLFIVLGYMLQMNWQLTLISLTFMVIFKLLNWPLEKKFELLYKLDEKIHTLMEQTQNESLSMISSVKYFSKEPVHLGEQADALDQMSALSYKRNLFRFLDVFTWRICTSASFGLSLYLINVYGENITIRAGDLTAFFLLLTDNAYIFERIQSEYLDILRDLPKAEKITELMNKQPVMRSGPLEPDTLAGRIEFRGVSFTYPSRPGQQVISGLSLELAPGKVTAVVGDSGAGKSTLTNLLMRLYDPTHGDIFVDGFNLKELNLAAFHRHIAVVNQNPLLFNCSIGDNIAYGAAHEDVTEEEITAAAKLANAHDFIMSFRGGFDTLAGTLGTKLSGGQKQRLAIARAAIRNPKILILDEATSSLDAENEKIVNEALEKIMKGRTILIIAHRLSTVRDADEILVMKAGRVVERGSHHQLLQLDGAYRKLVSKQLDQGLETL